MSETNPVMITSGGQIPTVLEVISDFIVANGPATFGTDLFIGYNKDAPGLVRWLNIQPGTTGQTMRTAVAWEEHTVLLSVRGDKGQYTAPRDDLIRLRYLLLTIQDYTSRGLTLHAVTSPQSWRELGRDISDREGFQATLECMVSKSYV
jgi:hypothetical protein